jgi:hypothetical protein
MKTVKLSTGQIVSLSVETDVFSSHPKMDMFTIHLVRSIKAKITPIVENYFKSRDALITKYGVEKDGNKSISPFLDEDKAEPNPQFTEFQEEIQPIVDKIESIEIEPLDVSLLKLYPQGDFNIAWTKAVETTGIFGFNYIFELFEAEA